MNAFKIEMEKVQEQLKKFVEPLKEARSALTDINQQVREAQRAVRRVPWSAKTPPALRHQDGDDPYVACIGRA